MVTLLPLSLPKLETSLGFRFASSERIFGFFVLLDRAAQERLGQWEGGTRQVVQNHLFVGPSPGVFSLTQGGSQRSRGHPKKTAFCFSRVMLFCPGNARRPPGINKFKGDGREEGVQVGEWGRRRREGDMLYCSAVPMFGQILK